MYYIIYYNRESSPSAFTITPANVEVSMVDTLLNTITAIS